MYMILIFFIQSPTKGHFGCFYFLEPWLYLIPYLEQPKVGNLSSHNPKNLYYIIPN